MGAEIRCTARLGERVAEGKALLETSEIVFRGGDLRLKIPFETIDSVEAGGGALRIAFSDGLATFELGPQAEKWAKKILNPPSLLDKLGVKPGMRVSVLGVAGAAFVASLRDRGASVSEGEPAAESDAIFVAIESRDDLAMFAALRGRIKNNGAIWAVRPKGVKQITEADVMAAGKAAGLVDVKVAKFSDTHTAEKLVIPVDRR